MEKWARDTLPPHITTQPEYREASALVTLIIAVLTFRNMSIESVYKVITYIKDDPLMPYIIIIITSWLTNLVTGLSVRQSPTQGARNSIWLEDAYTDRHLVSMQMLESEDLFSSFLRTRLKDRSAWSMIEAGSYYLILDHQFGQAMSVAEACSGRLRPGDRVIVSIWYRASSAYCLGCLNKLKCKQGSSYYSC